MDAMDGMDSASHNPVEWNALKFIGPTGMFLDADEGAEMRRWLERPIARAGWAELGAVRHDTDAVAFTQRRTEPPHPDDRRVVVQCHRHHPGRDIRFLGV